jgi:hypothetical protein
MQGVKVIKETGRLFIFGSGMGTCFHHERKRDVDKVAKERKRKELALPLLTSKFVLTTQAEISI